MLKKLLGSHYIYLSSLDGLLRGKQVSEFEVKKETSDVPSTNLYPLDYPHLSVLL